MRCLPLQTLGCEQLKLAVRAKHIGRADLSHHIGRDLPDDLIETDLRVDWLRHSFAQATEQNARPGEWPSHWNLSQD